MFGMPISFQSIALIITSTSIAAGLTRPMINTTYYPIIKYIYSSISFYSYVHYLLYPMSNLLLVFLCLLILISMFVGLLAFFLCSILVEFRLLIFLSMSSTLPLFRFEVKIYKDRTIIALICDLNSNND